MASLNEIMCSGTTFCIVVHTGGRSEMQTVTNGYVGRARFDFNFTSHNFQIYPVAFTQSTLDSTERQKRDASIALFQNHAVLQAVGGLNFNLGVEQDAIILDDGTLHDLRRGADSSHSPDRTSRPTQATPAGRQIRGYFHTHPQAALMRPPTPSSDWNEVPGVGFPGTGSVLHFMIESNKRVWGLLQNRRAFAVGKIQRGRLFTITESAEARNACWGLS